MFGMNRQTGKALTGIEHVEQSIVDILTTPIYSRRWRLEYGSRLPEIVDNPIIPSTTVDVYQASADAISLWEPRYTLKNVSIQNSNPDIGFLGLILNGDIHLSTYKYQGEIGATVIQGVELEIVIPSKAATQSLFSHRFGKPVIDKAPSVIMAGNTAVISLKSIPIGDMPIQLSIDGVLHPNFEQTGAELRIDYPAIGDQVVVYYYEEMSNA